MSLETCLITEVGGDGACRDGEGKKGGRTVAGMHHLSQPLHSVVSVDADKYRIAVAGWIGLD